MTQRGSDLRTIGYRLLGGAEGDGLWAYVAPTGVVTRDRELIGILNPDTKRLAEDNINPLNGVRPTPVSLNPHRWRVTQVSLPPLTGRSAGCPLSRAILFNPVSYAAEWLDDQIGFG